MQTLEVSSMDQGTRLDDLRPQLVCEVRDGQLGTVGYLVIDRTLGNASLGGIRLAPDMTVDEIAGLARAMTLKCSFLRTYIGGAKAGITVPESVLASNRDKVLAAFGRGLAPILQCGIYYPGEDIGISTDDLNMIRQAAGLDAIDQPSDGAYYAAVSAAETIKQSLRSLKCEVAGATAAIEGFGRVGSNIAVILAAQGVKIVAVSTSEGAIINRSGLDVGQMVALMKAHGDRFVSEYADAERINLPDLVLLDVDVVVPCARAWTITSQNASQVRARTVIPGANIAVTPEAEVILFKRGIIYVPDFLTNGGAVLAASMIAWGFRDEDIPAVIQREFAWKLARLLEKARASGVLPSVMAREIAWRNFDHMQSELSRQSSGLDGLLKKTFERGPRATLQRVAGVVYRRKWLQAGFVHDLALADLRQKLLADHQ